MNSVFYFLISQLSSLKIICSLLPSFFFPNGPKVLEITQGLEMSKIKDMHWSKIWSGPCHRYLRNSPHLPVDSYLQMVFGWFSCCLKKVLDLVLLLDSMIILLTLTSSDYLTHCQQI